MYIRREPKGKVALKTIDIEKIRLWYYFLKIISRRIHDIEYDFFNTVKVTAAIFCAVDRYISENPEEGERLMDMIIEDINHMPTYVVSKAQARARYRYNSKYGTVKEKLITIKKRIDILYKMIKDKIGDDWY